MASKPKNTPIQLQWSMGSFLHRERRRAGLSRSELAGKAGLSGASYVRSLERGKRWPRAGTLAAILTALGSDQLAFVSGKGDGC